MKTRRHRTIQTFTSTALCILSLTGAAQIACWQLTSSYKCGVELIAALPTCIGVTCPDKEDCTMISLEQWGKTDCKTNGCFCVASYYAPVQRLNPNPPPTYFWVCGPTGTPTIPPPGTGGSGTDGYLPASAGDCRMGG